MAKVSATGVVTGVHSGQATITCTAKDNGEKATCTITVNPTSYMPIAEGGRYYDTLSAGIHFWYCFTPTETGYYRFLSTSSSSADTKASLFQGTTALISDDNGAEEYRQFEIRYKLYAGTTYGLQVQGASANSTGVYAVTVTKCWSEVSKPEILPRSDWGGCR